jgi:DNA primase
MVGKLVGFCAIDILGKKRWLEYHPLKTENDYKKVLYPMNFSSSDFLFGYDDYDKSSESLIIVEGPREVMKLSQEGYKNAVAVMGSYMSDQHLAWIMKLSPKVVILLFDGDNAGVETTRRVGVKLSRAFKGDSLQKRFVPQGRDPKNLSRDELEKLIKIS